MTIYYEAELLTLIMARATTTKLKDTWVTPGKNKNQ